MKSLLIKSLPALTLWLCVVLPLGNVCAAGSTASEQSSSSSTTSQSSIAITITAGSDDPADDSKDKDDSGDGHNHDNAKVGIFHDSTLAAGEQADAVVSILGSSTSDGDVKDAVVSILGNTRVTGPVGDSAVAVLGSTYVNSKIGSDVVAVLGDVELGPDADVKGQVVAVGGVVKRDPKAIVHGGIQNVSFSEHIGGFEWLHSWIEHCLMYGRPLAFAPGLGWAWTLALVSLLFYVLTALMSPRSVEQCMQVLDMYPGKSLIAALLATLAAPVLIVLLCITIIGIIAVPFVGLGLMLASWFGKLVMLAWLGRRVAKSTPDNASGVGHPAFAVLIGGIMVTIAYVVPVLGFIVYKLLGFVGLGVVMYTLLLAMQARRHTESHTDNTPRSNVGGNSGAGLGSAPNVNTASDAGAPHMSAAPSSTADVNVTPDPQAQMDQSTNTANTAQSTPAQRLALLAQPRAGFWLRMGALLLDLILIGVLVHFVFDSGKLHLLLLAAYGAVMWKLKGATIGGIVCNIQLVRLDGREIDWATAIVRALSCFLSLFALALGFFWIAFDPQKQAWHDKIAGTVVVRAPQGTPLV